MKLEKDDLRVVSNIPPASHYNYEHKFRHLNALRGVYQSIYNALTFCVSLSKYLEDISKTKT